jgi:glycolate oxidase FAD binding subunit
MDAFVQSVQERVRAAFATTTPLVIRGGGTKSFYGAPAIGEFVDMRDYAGIIDYQPRELVLTVRAGTTLEVIEAAMASEGQMLPFEPPHFAHVVATGATIGGTVAAGLSGPRRAYTGAVRDFVLGTRIINGKGEDLHFGGRVIKNVAGYDVSRLMVGAMGTLGVLLDLSFKVLPKPSAEVTLRFAMDEATSIRRFNEWAGQPLPLSASYWHDGVAMLRLSGTHAGVAAAIQKLGGEEVPAVEASAFWAALRDHRLPYFASTRTSLWRLSVPATTPPLALHDSQVIEWGGALRWLAADVDAQSLREQIERVGGHATLMRAPVGLNARVKVFHPMRGKLAELNANLKRAFDPANVLNRGRLDNIPN